MSEDAEYEEGWDDEGEGGPGGLADVVGLGLGGVGEGGEDAEWIERHHGVDYLCDP